MNKKLLRSFMSLHGDTYKDLAKLLQIADKTVSDKVNERGGAEFKQGEIKLISRRYKLTPKQIVDIFFAA